MDYSFLREIPGAICKPEPRERSKRRDGRTEQKTKSQVRAEVAERDGFCRVHAEAHRTLCSGRSEWAHIEARSLTRGMEPTRRHSTQNSMMCCKRHHMELDAHLWDVHYIDPDKGCDGPIEVRYR